MGLIQCSQLNVLNCGALIVNFELKHVILCIHALLLQFSKCRKSCIFKAFGVITLPQNLLQRIFLQMSSLQTYTGKPVNTHAIHDEVAIMLLISVKR